MLIDTHCHIQFNAYREDMNEVIKRAREARVFMIAVGSQRDTSAKAVEVASANQDLIWAAVGLHPNHLFAMSFDEDELSVKTRTEVFDPAYYRELAKNPKVVAIGECGLDYYRLPEDVPHDQIITKQKQIFREHLDLAHELNLPVIVHVRSEAKLRPASLSLQRGEHTLQGAQRLKEGSLASINESEGAQQSPVIDAHLDTHEILKEYVSSGRLKRRGVVHCFTAGRKEARRYLDLDFYIAFGGVITFKSKKPEHLELLEAARETPLERIVIETDAPYLTPEPHRGKRNEPAYVKYVAERLADLRGISYDLVAQKTADNAKILFNLNPHLNPPPRGGEERGSI